MQCPFPGMDPYIERPAIWPDFHDTLVAAIRGALQPVLRPKYVALTQERLYVVESERSIWPDVSVVRPSAPRTSEPERQRESATATIVEEADAPAGVFELVREEVREPYVTIIDPADENHVVTAIEVLSPSNKQPGSGRTSYLEKRDEYWQAGTNLVEIDLLRDGEPTVRISQERLDSLRPWTYLVAVTRILPTRQEVYASGLRSRLPRVAVPLAPREADVPLNLQAAFERCWSEGPYPELSRYDAPPPGTMTEEDIAWCGERLRADGFRTASQKS